MTERSNQKWYSGMITKEDWWAIWLGLGLIFLTMIFFWSGSTIKPWAVTPGSWSNFSEIGKDKFVSELCESPMEQAEVASIEQQKTNSQEHPGSYDQSKQTENDDHPNILE